MSGNSRVRYPSIVSVNSAPFGFVVHLSGEPEDEWVELYQQASAQEPNTHHIAGRWKATADYSVQVGWEPRITVWCDPEEAAIRAAMLRAKELIGEVNRAYADLHADRERAEAARQEEERERSEVLAAQSSKRAQAFERALSATGLPHHERKPERSPPPPRRGCLETAAIVVALFFMAILAVAIIRWE